VEGSILGGSLRAVISGIISVREIGLIGRVRRKNLPRTLANNPPTHLAAYYLYARICAEGREKEKEEVTFMRRIVLLITVAALFVVGTLFTVSVAGAHKKHPAAGTHEKHPAAMAQKHPTRTVVIRNFRFKRAHITIKRGTRVRWINKDSTAHTVTANKAGSFDSGRLGPGQRYSHTFKRVGKKRYHCKIHPDMRGSVVVKR
jgi:plastocyanin